MVKDPGSVFLVGHRVDVAGNSSGIVAVLKIHQIKKRIPSGSESRSAVEYPVSLGTFGKDFRQRQAVSFVMAAHPEE